MESYVNATWPMVQVTGLSPGRRSRACSSGHARLKRAWADRISASSHSASAANVRRSTRSQLRSVMSELRSQEAVSLSGRNMGDEGCAYVADALALNDVCKAVDFTSNAMGVLGATQLTVALEGNAALEELVLGGNALGDEGCKVLCDFLATSSVPIEILNLSSNGIGDEGAAAVAEMLRRNTRITSLDLSNNMIDYEGTVDIAKALAENASLAELRMGGNYVGSMGASALGEGLKANEGLTELALGGNDIGDGGVVQLARGLQEHKGALTSLDLGNNGVGVAAAKELGAYVAKAKDLKKLNLYMNELGDEGAKALCDGFVANAKSVLESLDIGGNNIGPGGAPAVAELVKERASLVTLEMGYNPIGPKGAEAIAGAIKYGGSLETLRLGWCKLDKEGAGHLAEAMRFNETIRVLDVRGNVIADQGCAAFARSLRIVCERMTELDMGYNEIKDDGAYAMAEALKQNTDAALVELGMQNNYISKFGSVALQEAKDIVEEINSERTLNINI